MATYTNLQNPLFANAALQAFVAELAPFSAFSTNFSPEPAVRGSPVLVPLVAALTATTFAGNYAISGGSASVITVTMNRQKHVPVGQSDLDAANSSRASLELFGFQQGRALAQAVLQDIFTLLTTANFGSATAISSTVMSVEAIRASRLLLNQANAPYSPRSLILDAVPMDALLGITNFVQSYAYAQNNVLQEGKLYKALGFNLSELNNLFPSTGSVMGFAAHASAIAIAMRYLAPQNPGRYDDARAITDPSTGLTIGLRDHFDPNTGMRYVNLEALYGFSVGISQGGRIIKRLD